MPDQSANDAILAAMKGKGGRNHSFWIGLKEDVSIQWFNESELSFKNWSDGQPELHGHFNFCGVMDKFGEWKV